MSDVTRILSLVASGDPHAADELLPLVYDELRKLASARLANERPGQTLQGTALVHEAYLRLVDGEVGQPWNGRGHFFAAAAEAMRRILIERARRKHSQKGGGGRHKVTFNDSDYSAEDDSEKLLAIDDVLDQLAIESPEIANVVKLRVFAGFTMDDVASALGISRSTAFRHWTYARAWLRAALAEER